MLVLHLGKKLGIFYIVLFHLLRLCCDIVKGICHWTLIGHYSLLTAFTFILDQLCIQTGHVRSEDVDMRAIHFQKMIQIVSEKHTVLAIYNKLALPLKDLI